MKSLLWLKRIGYIALVLLSFWLLKTGYHYLKIAGVITQHQPILAQQCQKIPVALNAQHSLGTEDIAIDRETGLVMISAMNRFDYALPKQDPVDGIYGFVLGEDGSSSVKELKLISADAPERFHPHGISFWSGISDSGITEKRLFVVNHRSRTDKAIEIFRVTDAQTLEHLETITSPEIYSPNDIVGVSADTFYVTNDKGRGEGLLIALERFLFLPRSSAAFYDGNQAFTVAKGQIFANGITASADFKTLYIANAFAQEIRAFKRKPDHHLQHFKTYTLNTGPDNIDIAEDGSLWTGAHSKLFDYLRYVQKKQPYAPSQVVRIDPQSDKHETVLYTEDGELSASSAAATFAGRLIVGSVFEGAILNCPYTALR